MTEFTMVWQDEDMGIWIETVSATSVEDATNRWEHKNPPESALIGVLEGRVNVLEWHS